MEYLTAEEILAIHARIVDKTSGAHGVREVGLLLSIIESPKTTLGGQEMYKGVFSKAAVYLEKTARYYVFVDGNKRTSLALAARFMYKNGYKLVAENKEMVRFVLAVVTEHLELGEIADWLEKNSQNL